MTTYELRHRAHALGLRRPAAWGLIAFAVAWTVAAAIAIARGPDGTLVAVVLVPAAVVCSLVFLVRGAVPPAIRGAIGWTVTGAGALAAALLIVKSPLFALVAPAIVISALVTNRFPVASLVFMFFLTGFFGSIAAFVGFQAPPLVDLILAGLWGGTLWFYAFSVRERPVWLWPGVLLVALYVGLTLFSVFVRDEVEIALRSFRLSVWYLMAFFLLAFGPWAEGQRSIHIARGFVAVALLVGSYATFRYIFGQSDTETNYTLSVSPPAYEIINGNLRLFGSVQTGRLLAGWTASAIPFCLAVALMSNLRWRVVALAACATSAIALFGTDVRTGLVAVVPAVLLVLALYQLSRAFPGLHLGSTVVATIVMAVIGIGAFAYTLGGKPLTEQRYVVLITDPTKDLSYQGRLVKWREAFANIEQQPLGQGMGTSGSIQKRFGRFHNISNYEVDSSYLKVALEQGFGMMILFVVSLVVLLYGLIRRAVLTTDPTAAGLAIGAAGVLVAAAILMYAATSIEGLPALAGWMMIGLGAAALVRKPTQPSPADQSPPS